MGDFLHLFSAARADKSVLCSTGSDARPFSLPGTLADSAPRAFYDFSATMAAPACAVRYVFKAVWAFHFFGFFLLVAGQGP
ncbi:MAG: hypothetical protein ACNA8L_10375 [Luteolibacter sp.]